MKVLGSIEWRAFSSGCREVDRLQVHTGWRMERFDKHQDTNEVRKWKYGVGYSPGERQNFLPNAQIKRRGYQHVSHDYKAGPVNGDETIK